MSSFQADLNCPMCRPILAFIIAALGQYGNAMNPNIRKVHEALMAVEDPAKHPVFKDNVTSIDTIPFFFPSDQSPGGREWDCHNNAESFLLIGEAMGGKMMHLMK